MIGGLYRDTIEYCKGCRRAMDRFWAFEDEQYCTRCWSGIKESMCHISNKNLG